MLDGGPLEGWCKNRNAFFLHWADPLLIAYSRISKRLPDEYRSRSSEPFAVRVGFAGRTCWTPRRHSKLVLYHVHIERVRQRDVREIRLSIVGAGAIPEDVVTDMAEVEELNAFLEVCPQKERIPKENPLF